MGMVTLLMLALSLVAILGLCEIMGDPREGATAKWTNTATDATYAKGVLDVFGSAIGFPIENIGTSEEEVGVGGSDYPNGPDGVIVFRGRVKLDKEAGTGISFEPLDNVYYDDMNHDVTNVSTANTLVGKALEAADDNDCDVLVDLVVLS
jgi:predicted RecA/RadA family phage recombinase